MLINCKCDLCGKEFSRNNKEVNRSLRMGRKFFCSRQCTGKSNAKNLPIDKSYNVKNLVPHNRRDEYSPFRTILRTAQRHAREKKKEFQLTLENLKQQWDNQQGICPYTKWQMVLKGKNPGKVIPSQASLDRINSSLGYVPNNIQFISLIVQYCKNKWEPVDVWDFCRSVAETHSESFGYWMPSNLYENGAGVYLPEKAHGQISIGDYNGRRKD